MFILSIIVVDGVVCQIFMTGVLDESKVGPTKVGSTKAG